MLFKETVFNNHLAEIKQQKDVKFALLYRKGKYYTNVMPWIKCRDFFNEVVTSNWDGKKRSIYGFSWNPKEQKTYKTKTVIALKFDTLDDRLVFQRSLSQYEYHFNSYMGVPLYNTIHTPTDTIVILEAPAFWLKTTVGMSLWTYLLKCMCYEHNNGPASQFFDRIKDMTVGHTQWDGTIVQQKTNEGNYYQRTQPVLHTLMRNIKTILKNPKTPHGHEPEAKIDKVHNDSGFVFLCEWKAGFFGKKLEALL
jgi:hypothetical protein